MDTFTVRMGKYSGGREAFRREETRHRLTREEPQFKLFIRRYIFHRQRPEILIRLLHTSTGLGRLYPLAKPLQKNSQRSLPPFYLFFLVRCIFSRRPLFCSTAAWHLLIFFFFYQNLSDPGNSCYFITKTKL